MVGQMGAMEVMEGTLSLLPMATLGHLDHYVIVIGQRMVVMERVVKGMVTMATIWLSR